MLVRTVILLTFVAFGSSTPATPVYDTIIVGMGAAGSAAASVLCRAGKNVLALEAMDRVGGRVHTVPFGGGVVEVGAEWYAPVSHLSIQAIHGEHPNPVYELAVQHNISLFKQDLDIQVFRSDGSDAQKDIFLELVNVGIEAIQNPPKDPEPEGQYLTRRLMEHITIKHPALLNDKDFIELFLHAFEAMINSNDAAYSWKDLTTHRKYRDVGGHLYWSWHGHGYKMLFELLLNTYNGGPGYPTLNLQLEKVVTKVSYPQEPAQDVQVGCKDGSVYRARSVIVTVSLGVLKESHTTLFSPVLPPSKISAIDNISMGLIGKIVLLFPKPWWGNSSEEFAFLWTKEDRRELSKDWTFDCGGVTKPMGNRNALTLWTYGNSAKLAETLAEDVVKRKAMEVIRRFLGNGKNVPEPIDMLRTTWYSNPHTRGAYSFDNVQAPQRPNDRANLAEPLVDSSGAPRVLFAGEASNSIHYATVHGAVETGYREANRLLPKVSA